LKAWYQMLPAAYMAAALDLCRSTGIWFVADQAHRLLQDPAAAAAAAAAPPLIPTVTAKAGVGGREGAGLRPLKVVMVDDVSYAVGVGGWGVAHAVVGGGASGKVEDVLGGLRGSLAGLPAQVFSRLISSSFLLRVGSNVLGGSHVLRDARPRPGCFYLQRLVSLILIHLNRIESNPFESNRIESKLDFSDLLDRIESNQFQSNPIQCNLA